MDSLSTFGLTANDYDETIDVWSCNEDSVYLFTAMATQWNYGPTGQRVGMRYEALGAVMDRCYLRLLPEERKDELFADVRLMELEALHA